MEFYYYYNRQQQDSKIIIIIIFIIISIKSIYNSIHLMQFIIHSNTIKYNSLLDARLVVILILKLEPMSGCQ